jgi:hypothetical protein
MISNRVFVGREADLAVLRNAYEEARAGKPRIVAIVAESGFGKTRLAQEFYGWLSTAHDGVGGAGYWPDQLLQRENNLQVNPDLAECGGDGKQLPFLWWGMRVADPGSRNQSLEDALRHGVATLKSHLEAYVTAQKVRDLSKQRFSSAKDTFFVIAADVGKGVLSSATFGLFDLSKALLDGGREQLGITRQLKELKTFDASPDTTVKRQRDKLTETILHDLAVLAKTPPPGRSAVPLVILIDDIQWLHADSGLEAFLEALTARAKAEAWPLLLVFTSWRKEWHNSKASGTAPGKWIDRDDISHELGRANGLEALVQQALPGLPENQRMELAGKADGNPRLLDEMLTYIQRQPKLFVERDQSGPMSAKGLKAVLEQGFADYVLDRLQAAPTSVQKALALASLQGIVFSSNLVQRVAAELLVDGADEGIMQSDTPHSFTTMEEGGEFRLRVYQEVARENTENFFDEDKAQAVTTKYVLSVASDPVSANDRELRLALDALREAADQDVEVAVKKIKVAAEMIRRANAAFDTRSAGLIARDILEAGSGWVAVADLDDSDAVLHADQEWHGHSVLHLACWQNLIDRRRKNAASLAPGTQRSLAIALADLGSVVEKIDGPAAALPLREEMVALTRVLAREQPTPGARRGVAVALANLGDVVQKIDGPAAALPLREEEMLLMRTLAEEQPTTDSRRDLAITLGRLGGVIDELKGPSAARALREEEVMLIRILVETSPTPNARRDLAIALGRLGGVVEALDGPAAARPLREEEMLLMRNLAEAQPTPGARRELAIALGNFGGMVQALDGPAAARSVREEMVALMRILSEEQPTPLAQCELAIALGRLGGVVQELDGPAMARPLHEEEMLLTRAFAEEQPTPIARRELAVSLGNLGGVVQKLDGPAAARPMREEMVALMRTLAEEQPTPTARREFAMSLAFLADVVHSLDGPAAARPLHEEEMLLKRTLVEEQPTPTACHDLVVVLANLGDVVQTLDGPAAARPMREEMVALMRTLTEEQPTSGALRELAISLDNLADVVHELDGPAAARPLYEEEMLLKRTLVEEQPTPSARLSLAITLSNLGDVVEALSGPVAARPLREEEIQIHRTLAEEQPTPIARRNLAVVLSKFGSVVEALEGPAAARPLREETVALMRTLAQEQQHPKVFEDLIFCLKLLADCLDLGGSFSTADSVRQEVEMWQERLSL